MRKRRESAIQQYMQAWVDADEHSLLWPLAQDVQIVESHGPAYQGIDQVRRWFRDWIQHGQVLSWDALHFWHDDQDTIVKWRFRCRYEGNETAMDGMSLVRFRWDGTIGVMEEYQAKAEHFFPYKIAYDG